LSTLDQIDDVKGSVFNLGGGAGNTVSLIEAIDAITAIIGERPELSFEGWRPGDQPWYVSDIGAISARLGWTPKIAVTDGLDDLHGWLSSRFGKPARTAAYEGVPA